MRYNRGILENAGVSVIAARQFDMAYYDESIGPGGFEEKNRIFQKITKERRREFRQMIELEIPEALLAEAYFESNGNKTIAEIAGETGFPPRSLKEITQEAVRLVEEEAIKKALFMCKWNRRKAAEMLSISYKTLFYKMRQYNLFE